MAIAIDQRQLASALISTVEKEGRQPAEQVKAMALIAGVHALLAIADSLERIDDALRNTVGGRP